MGKIRLLTLFVVLGLTFSQSSAPAAAPVGGGDDSYGVGGVNSGSGGIPVDGSSFNLSGPGNIDTSGQVDLSSDCSRSSDAGNAGICWGMTGQPPPPTDDKGSEGTKGTTQTGKDSKDKGEGDAKDDAAAEAERLAAACRSEFQSVINACDGSISTTSNSCDSNQSNELKSAAAQIGQSGQSSESAVNKACVEAGGASQAARDAMSSFRQKCNGALNVCRSTCQEVTQFLQSKPQCYPALGMNSAQAQSLAQSKAASCESYQARVSEADQSIANYNRTATASAACDAATNGGVSEASAGTTAAVGSNAFCQMNPTYPGCGSSMNVNCATDTTSLVCICSVTPSDSRCKGDAGNAEFVQPSSLDSSSRLAAAKEDVLGDLPNTPDIAMQPVQRSGDIQEIDGRQGGAGVGEANLSGAAMPPTPSSVQPVDESFLDMLAGFFGGGSSGRGGGGFIEAILPGSRDGQRTPASAGAASKEGVPDLRQFLPGGMANPFHSKIAGAAVGLDGITGPHSDIWKKVRNRYQVLQGTFEP